MAETDEQLNVQYSDVTQALAADSVLITNPDLVNALIHDQAGALGVLSTVSQVSVNDISVDALGRVIVANAGFAAALKEKASHEMMDSNGACAKANAYCPVKD